MGDYDSKLIFESYKDQLITEAWGALLIPLLAPIGAYVAGKYELTSSFTEKIKESTNGLVDIDGLMGLLPIQIASLFDPTGVTQWPNVEKAIKEYEKEPSSWNKFSLYLSLFATIPVIGRLKILMRGVGSSRDLSLYAGTFTKFFVNILDKKMSSIFSDPKFQATVIRYINNSPEKTKRIIVSFLSLFGAKWALSALGAGTMVAASGAEKQIDTDSNVTKGSSENPINVKFSDIPNSATKNKSDYVDKVFLNDKDGKYYKITE
jgi:hypothetical protein